MMPMRKTAILFALLAATALTPLAALGQERALRGVALVVGEGEYENLPALANPPNDARDVGDLLADLGFDVTTVRDADQRRLTRAFERFAEDAAEADVALVYYSGHGLEVAGANYLVPVDADISTPELAGQSLVPLGGLLDELAETVPVTIMLLDACRSDPFPAGQVVALPETGEVVAVESTGLAAVRGPTPVKRGDVESESLGMVIGFAAEPGAAALDGAPGENSPYAAALLKHVAANGTAFADIMTMVTEEVYLKTRARQLPWTNSSLRRVLSFGEAPEDAEGDEALIRDGRRALLMSISSAPEATRRYVETVANTEGVPLDALYGMLKVLGVDTAAEANLESQLLEGAQKLKDFMAARPGAVKTDTELVRLAGLADAAQQEGAIDLALRFRQEASARADTLEANVDEAEANIEADRLQIGATYAEHARTAVLNFDFATAAQMWGKAHEQVARWDEALALDYQRQQAGALADHGHYRGDNDALAQAIALYEAISPKAEATDQWGPIRNDLGNALEELGERQSDSGMLERAVAAYEDALSRTPRDGYPLEWARTQSNLGVTLMNLGQRARGTDLLERSANAFGTALEEMTRDKSPIEWAKTTSNFGNVMQLLADRNGDEGLYYEAADAHQAALEVLVRDVMPLDWATAQANLGNALARIADQQDAPEGYDGAVAAFRLSLEERPREKVPLQWAVTQDALGSVLASRAMRSGVVADFDAAIAAYKAALEERTVESSPLDFGHTTANLALALKKRGELLDGPEAFDDAIAQYRAALGVFTIDNAPMMWAQTEANLGIVLLARANRSGEEADLLAARDAYEAALSVYAQVSAEYAEYFEGKLAEIDERLGR